LPGRENTKRYPPQRRPCTTAKDSQKRNACIHKRNSSRCLWGRKP
jgi:hypothetical protein